MLQQSLENYNYQLNSLPDISSIKKQAGAIRRQLLERFGGQERLGEMTFEDKRALLHWLFEGNDHEGTAYGIYTNKTGKGKASKIDYFIYGKISGLITLKGDDINYQEDEIEYKTNNIGLKR
jgi:hypothetical protein